MKFWNVRKVDCIFHNSQLHFWNQNWKKYKNCTLRMALPNKELILTLSGRIPVSGISPKKNLIGKLYSDEFIISHSKYSVSGIPDTDISCGFSKIFPRTGFYQKFALKLVSRCQRSYGVHESVAKLGNIFRKIGCDYARNLASSTSY